MKHGIIRCIEKSELKCLGMPGNDLPFRSAKMIAVGISMHAQT